MGSREDTKALRDCALCLHASPTIFRRVVNFTQTSVFILCDLRPLAAEFQHL